MKMWRSKKDRFVIVKYDQQHYPGEVLKVDEEKTEATVMHRSGSYWKWPTSPDSLWYAVEDIFQEILNPPRMVNNRGCYVGPEMQQFAEYYR
ncbi:hypothetical protein QE152_g26616 [Popillia japonica]|uniref:Uncharacterized protein n=1 Tax=Popillia japonica TaxID=7064 RepID=A0AAW1JXC4_POPJA